MMIRYSARLLALAFALVSVGLGAGCNASAGSAEDGSGAVGEEISRGAASCAQDTDCNHGVDGLGVVCLIHGKNKGKCADNCHTDSDCPGGGSCDKSTDNWQCDDPLPEIGTRCEDDAFC